MNKSNWIQVAKMNLKSCKPRCACWQWCPGKLVGCSPASTKAAVVADSNRASLDQAGLKDVSASQDRDKGVVTLEGHVAADGDKSKAESSARAQVVSNQIPVTPPVAQT